MTYIRFSPIPKAEPTMPNQASEVKNSMARNETTTSAVAPPENAALPRALHWHWSDCAVNNGPAMPTGPCDCGGSAMFKVGDVVHSNWFSLDGVVAGIDGDGTRLLVTLLGSDANRVWNAGGGDVILLSRPDNAGYVPRQTRETYDGYVSDCLYGVAKAGERVSAADGVEATSDQIAIAAWDKFSRLVEATHPKTIQKDDFLVCVKWAIGEAGKKSDAHLSDSSLQSARIAISDMVSCRAAVLRGLPSARGLVTVQEAAGVLAEPSYRITAKPNHGEGQRKGIIKPS